MSVCVCVCVCVLGGRDPFKLELESGAKATGHDCRSLYEINKRDTVDAHGLHGAQHSQGSSRLWLGSSTACWVMREMVHVTEELGWECV